MQPERGLEESGRHFEATLNATYVLLAEKLTWVYAGYIQSQAHHILLDLSSYMLDVREVY